MSLKAKLEAIIYATEEPVTLNELAVLLKDVVLADMRAEEEARLELNETISDGPPPPEDDEEEPIFEDEVAVTSVVVRSLPTETVRLVRGDRTRKSSSDNNSPSWYSTV